VIIINNIQIWNRNQQKDKMTAQISPFIGCQKEFKQKIKKEKHTYPKLYSEITPLINKRNIMESIHRNTYD
jgi:hypothetical protein